MAVSVVHARVGRGGAVALRTGASVASPEPGVIDLCANSLGDDLSYVTRRLRTFIDLYCERFPQEVQTLWGRALFLQQLFLARMYLFYEGFFPNAKVSDAAIKWDLQEYLVPGVAHLVSALRPVRVYERGGVSVFKFVDSKERNLCEYFDGEVVHHFHECVRPKAWPRRWKSTDPPKFSSDPFHWQVENWETSFIARHCDGWVRSYVPNFAPLFVTLWLPPIDAELDAPFNAFVAVDEKWRWNVYLEGSNPWVGFSQMGAFGPEIITKGARACSAREFAKCALEANVFSWNDLSEIYAGFSRIWFTYDHTGDKRTAKEHIQYFYPWVRPEIMISGPSWAEDRAAEIGAVLAMSLPSDRHRILDFGCESGRIFSHYLEWEPVETEVYGMFFPPCAVIESDVGYERVGYLDSSGRSDYRDGEFDVIYSANLEFVKQVGSFFFECGRLLRVGGVLILRIHGATVIPGSKVDFVDFLKYRVPKRSDYDLLLHYRTYREKERWIGDAVSYGWIHDSRDYNVFLCDLGAEPEDYIVLRRAAETYSWTSIVVADNRAPPPRGRPPYSTPSLTGGQ